MAKVGELKQFDWVWWDDEFLEIERLTPGGRKAKLIDTTAPPDEPLWVNVSELDKLTDAEYDEYVLDGGIYDDGYDGISNYDKEWE